ncbi:unnamed protein product [Durusdinium trenchii]|uniref:Uncharacterized protein n=1 Tax=Durusdinium trenchii TaxID=1381693 RepID=A0ABP0NWS9_9DINO
MEPCRATPTARWAAPWAPWAVFEQKGGGRGLSQHNAICNGICWISQGLNPRHACGWEPLRLVALALLVRRSHTKPQQVPTARRMRMLHRPKEHYAGNTGRGGNLKFLASPCVPTEDNKAQRSDRYGWLRKAFKNCRSKKYLLQQVNKAVERGVTEISLYSAAMQVCGNMCWWETFIEVRNLQKGMARLDAVAASIALTALAWCLRKNGLCDVREERKEPALRMAQEIWLEAAVLTNPVVLTSGLKLCTELDCPAAEQWGRMIWAQTQDAGLKKGEINFSAFITMLEKYQEFEEVDQMLATDHHLTSVLLGALLDCAAGRCDAKRADELWEKLVTSGKVKPIESSYNAYSRAHLMAGDPEAAMAKTEEMLKLKRGKLTWINAKDYAQALLILYHSMPANATKAHLKGFLATAQSHFAKEGLSAAPVAAVKEWEELRSRAKDLLKLSSQQHVRLQDLLVTQLSKDRTWATASRKKVPSAGRTSRTA